MLIHLEIPEHIYRMYFIIGLTEKLRSSSPQLHSSSIYWRYTAHTKKETCQMRHLMEVIHIDF